MIEHPRSDSPKATSAHYTLQKCMNKYLADELGSWARGVEEDLEQKGRLAGRRVDKHYLLGVDRNESTL